MPHPYPARTHTLTRILSAALLEPELRRNADASRVNWGGDTTIKHEVNVRYFKYLGFQLLKIIKAADLEGVTGGHVQREHNLRERLKTFSI